MKKYIVGIIIGILISSSAVCAANYLYKADEVSYTPSNTNWEVDNVDSAIKELYNKINDANSALLSLKNTNIAKAIGANGDTFSSVINKLGEITNQGNKSFTVSNTSSITIPAGYYNGTGKINVSGLVPTPSGTFTPTAHGTQIDMGANNTYRYINTTNVWNQAVAAADARSYPGSYNYQSGYNAGRTSSILNATLLGYLVKEGIHSYTVEVGDIIILTNALTSYVKGGLDIIASTNYEHNQTVICRTNSQNISLYSVGSTSFWRIYRS